MALNLPKGFTEADVVRQIDDHYESSIFRTNEKRALFRKRQKLYMNIADQENKIYNRLLFSVMQTLQALYSKDRPAVSFQVEGLWFDELEDNINMLAKSDFVTMNLQEKKEAALWNMFFYGCSIEAFDGYDPIKKVPTYRIMDPMTWISDGEWNVNDGYRYHGFEVEFDVNELTERNGYYVDVKELQRATMEDLVARAKETGQESRGFTDPGEITKIDGYHAFETFGKHRYLITLANGRSKVIRCQKIEPVTDEEKKNPLLVPDPVIVSRWLDCPRDEWGISLCDVLEDKQATLQLFQNLEKMRAEYATRGQYILYDKDLINDVKQLQQQSIGPKLVPATLSKGNPVQSFSPEGMTQDSQVLQQSLRNQMFLDLGMSETSLGAAGQRDITKGENDTIQANGNLKQLYGIKKYQRSQVKRRAYWYRSHVEFLNGKKKAQYRNDLGMSEYYEFTKEQLITYQNILVSVESSLEADEKIQKEKIGYMAMYSSIIGDPTKPMVSKKFAERKMLKLNGIAKQEVEVICPYTADELDAMQWLELINRNEMPPEITDLTGEDHYTYVVYYQRAKKTPAREKAIRVRLEAYKASGQGQRAVLAPTQAPDKQMQGQLTNQMMAQENPASKAISLQNVQ